MLYDFVQLSKITNSFKLHNPPELPEDTRPCHYVYIVSIKRDLYMFPVQKSQD